MSHSYRLSFIVLLALVDKRSEEQFPCSSQIGYYFANEGDFSSQKASCRFCQINADEQGFIQGLEPRIEIESMFNSYVGSGTNTLVYYFVVQVE